MTVDAIREQFPSRYKVSLALDGWTSTNNLTATLVVAYNIDQIWAFGEVQLTFDNVDTVIISGFEI